MPEIGDPPRAVLDANVLVPISLTDTLLLAAEGNLYQPLWSDKIFDEAIRHAIALNDPQIADRISGRFGSMNQAFSSAKVTDQDQQDMPFGLPDPGDEHVLRTAVSSRADLIVTNNVKDFPESILSPLSIIVLTADEFLTELFLKKSKLMANILILQARIKDNPKISNDQLLSALSAAGAPQFATAAKKYLTPEN